MKDLKDLNQWDNTVITIKFPRAACRDCQFRHLCTRSKKEPREINVQPKEEHLAIVKRRKQQKTKTWSKKYSQRAGVEGTISQGIRGFGLRECRYVGLDKVHLQHILTATAMNAVRLFAWFEGVPLAKTRVSSFAKLAPD